MRDRVSSAQVSALPLRRVHLVGIAGSGMRALAEYLRDAGWAVSGTDPGLTPAGVRRFAGMGIRAETTHAAEHLPPGAALLVYSQAVGPDNPERRAARQRGIEELSYPEMLGRLTQSRPALVVSGTHGKSTTTAMLASILQTAGRDPSVLMGAERLPDGRSGWSGAGDWLLAEGCEYRGAFLQLRPQAAVVLNVDHDHPDCYPDRAAVESAFCRFVQRVPPNGWVVLPCGSAASGLLAEAAAAPVHSFSPVLGDPGPKFARTWWAADVRTTCDGVRFRLFAGERFVTEVFTGVWGRHNVVNAVAAATAAAAIGVDGRTIGEGLAAFEGIRRRMQLVGYWRGVTLIDDYAHHPAEVEATLSAIRRRFASRRVWVCFQPHQILRVQRWTSAFARALRGVHRVLIVPAFPARETGQDVDLRAREAARRLATAVRAEGQPCGFEPSLDRLVATLDHALHVGDVLVTMGAGDISKVLYEFVGRLSRNRAAG